MAAVVYPLSQALPPHDNDELFVVVVRGESLGTRLAVVQHSLLHTCALAKMTAEKDLSNHRLYPFPWRRVAAYAVRSSPSSSW